MIKINIKRVSDKYNDIPLPEYATKGSAGLDIRAAIDAPIVIAAGKIAIVATNLSVEIPEGYEIQIRPRSGLAAKHGIGIVNSPGTIDSDYRGEIKIILINFSDEDFQINRGDRIAQMVIASSIQAEFIEVGSLGDTARGEGGFGHSGRK
jgi:dUTP pyrophosphatase